MSENCFSEEEKKEIRIQDMMAIHDMEYDEAKLFLDEERSKAADDCWVKNKIMKNYYQIKGMGYVLPQPIYRKTVNTIRAYNFYRSLSNQTDENVK